MTVTQLIRHLEKLKAKHGNLKVTVNKPELEDGNESWQICSISTAVVDWVYRVDGDGFVELTKKGYERGAWKIVLGNAPKKKQ